MVHRMLNERTDNEPQEVVIDMPFPCDTSGFIDPNVPGDQRKLDFDVFPLPNQPQALYSPPPSTKFLHLTLQERDRPKRQQTVQGGSKFRPGSYGVHNPPENTGFKRDRPGTDDAGSVSSQGDDDVRMQNVVEEDTTRGKSG